MAPSPAGSTPEPTEIHKRTAQDILADRAVKRRASRACLSCRSRKVRCDVVSSGPPCNNCRLDGIHCVLSETNRGKKLVSDDRENSPSLSSDGADTFAVSLRFDRRLDTPNLSEASYDSWEASPKNSGLSNLPSHLGGVPSPTSLDSHYRGLPPYIRPLPPHISIDDVEYLAKKGATFIPDDDLRDAILRSYVEYVHPFMPAVDLQSFLSPIVRSSNEVGNNAIANPVSLLLFQSVMFAGVAYVDVDMLRQSGYPSRKAARKIFFERARLLYALNYEPEWLSMIQALQLMSYWYESPEHEQDTWYWMGVMLSSAQVHGFHRNPEPYARLSHQEKKLRKRIWWSCYIRDRLLAVALRRPARIRQKDFDVPMLTIEDFDIEPLSGDIVTLLGDSSVAKDTDTKKTLAMICIALARLCVCIGNLLSSQYSILGSNQGGTESDPTITVMPQRSSEQAQWLVKCDAELDEWCQSLDSCCRYQNSQAKSAAAADNSSGSGSNGGSINPDEKTALVWLHQTMLRMVYLTAMGALHRPQVFLPSSSSSSMEINRRASRQKAKEAAAEITEIAYDLHERNQLRFLPSSSLCTFVSATLTHLLDLRFAKEFSVRNTCIGGFYQCMQALQHLQQMYSSADYAVFFLETAMRQANVRIPMLALGWRPLDGIPSPSSKFTDATPKARIATQHQPSSLSSTLLPSGTPRYGGHHQHIAVNNKYLSPKTNDIPNLASSGPINVASVPPPNYNLVLEPICETARRKSRGSQLAAEDMQASPPPASDWYDMDAHDQQLLPGVINFDLDPAFFAPT